ncbi:MAG: gliding motility lipoprotein GldH [Prevotella sp.]|nr:gliding motility lipoprotein GldH [Prevotella sp.]
MRRNKYTFLIYLCLLQVVMLTACKQRTVYHHYEHTPLSGWEKNDSLQFNIDTIRMAGTYAEEIGVRINGTYPFMQLNLIVMQTVKPAMKTHSDTLTCHLIDEQGQTLGSGVSNYQYTFPVTTLQLSEGDCVEVSVRHDMKREILPGISDIGFRLRRQD